MSFNKAHSYATPSKMMVFLMISSILLNATMNVESFSVSSLSSSKTRPTATGGTTSIADIATMKHLKNKHLVSFMSDYKNDGVVELVDDDEDEKPTTSKTTTTTASAAAPFLSQGEIQKEALEITNDPKQTRVIIYIILSLIPVLFLIPLMLGSRDLIPLDSLPPVPLT